MTINISLSIDDGIIIATDSATTLSTAGIRTRVYNNANKLFNLIKGLPLGSTTSGWGNIGKKTVAALTKDLRVRMTTVGDELAVDHKNYTVEEVARKAGKFFCNELRKVHGDASNEFDMQYRVFGYGSRSDEAEGWSVHVTGPDSAEASLIHSATIQGLAWCGMTEAVSRVVLGVSPQFFAAFPDGVDARPLYDQIKTHTLADIWTPGMPLQDGIELVQFLAETAAKYAKMTDLAAGIGGPIEIAAITRHEGFKWIARKHYFKPELN